jgi:hypothetical protein
MSWFGWELFLWVAALSFIDVIVFGGTINRHDVPKDPYIASLLLSLPRFIRYWDLVMVSTIPGLCVLVLVAYLFVLPTFSSVLLGGLVIAFGLFVFLQVQRLSLPLLLDPKHRTPTQSALFVYSLSCLTVMAIQVFFHFGYWVLLIQSGLVYWKTKTWTRYSLLDQPRCVVPVSVFFFLTPRLYVLISFTWAVYLLSFLVSRFLPHWRTG